MSEPKKNSGSSVAVSRPQRDRAKSLNDIISQQTRLLGQLDESDPRYARVRNITNRYAANIYDTPESRSNKEQIESIARGADLLDEEDRKRISELNRDTFGRAYTRSVYARKRR